MVAGWFALVPFRVHTFTGLLFPSATGLRRILLMIADALISAFATHVVAEGQGVRRDLQSHRITRRPLRVIGHGNIAGIDTEEFRSDNPDIPSVSGAPASDDFTFCFIGRLNRDKGLSELVTAFLGLPGEPRLLIAGRIDITAPINQGTFDLMQRHPRIHLLGFVEDVRAVLVAADVLVLPSYREGFPNVVLQAGAMSRPAIVTDINGSNEIVINSVNGWIVPPRNAGDLAQVMALALHTPPSTLQRMGKSARELIVAKYERREHWTRMLDFYSGLSGPTSPGSKRAPPC
jgi:glycosyltransferase involved in cell wall biosynthesis